LKGDANMGDIDLKTVAKIIAVVGKALAVVAEVVVIMASVRK